MAFTERHNGQVLSAISRLRALLKEPDRASLSAEAQWIAAVELLYICRTVYEIECLRTHIADLNTIHERLGQRNDPASLIRLQTITYFEASRIFLTQDPKLIQQGLSDGMLGRFEVPSSGRVYIDRQLLLARYLLSVGDGDGAWLAIDRALSLVLSITDVRPVAFGVAVWLSEIMELLVVSGDMVRGYGIHAVAGPFIAAALPRTSFEFAQHRTRELSLLYSLGQLKEAGEVAKDAQRLLAPLDLPVRARLILEAGVAEMGAITCVSEGDPECAKGYLRSHPLSKYADVISREQKVRPELLPFIALDSITDLWLGREVSPASLRHLREAVDATQIGHAARYDLFEGIRQAGLSMVLARQEPRESARNAVAAAKTRLRQLNRLLSVGHEGVPVVGLFDKLIVALGADPVFEGLYEDPDHFNVALQMIEVLNRSLRQAEADSYARLAMGVTEDDRRLLHAASRFATRQIQAELDRLRQLMEQAALPFHETTSPAVTFDLAERRYLAEHGNQIRSIRSRLQAQGRIVPSRIEVPKIEDVQALLAPDEVLVTFAFAFNRAFHLCVRADKAVVNADTIEPRQLVQDIRIVNEALTAGHAPSIQLDAQYPAAAGVRLFRVLLGPVQECLRGAQRLLWIPAAEVIGLPLAALLEEIPPALGEGYDLGAARWVGTRLAVSYLTSTRGFVAARRLARERTADMEFLGVGDPVLSGQTNDGTPRAVAVTRGALDTSDGALGRLPELPETSAELKKVVALFPESSTLLLREDATEARLRRSPLSQYRILDFATHGLVKEELRGLTEAALVLTPHSRTDTSDDGLLTSSEIADLSLNADLVVLSACNTARYDLGRFGVEVQGLATAFALAGVPQVVAALWPVESALTERLMGAFFEGIRRSKPQSASESLRSAMSQAVLSARGTAYAHPRFWASFSVFGEGVSTPTAISETKRVRFKRSELLTPTKRGEALGIALMPATGDVVTSGISDPVDGVYQSTVIRQTRQGHARWIFQDPETAGTGSIVATTGGIYVGSHSLGGSNYAPVITKLSVSGWLQWKKEIEHADLKAYVASLLEIPHGGLLALVSAYRERGGAQDERELIAVELTREGTEVRRTLIPMGKGAMWAIARAAVVGKRLVIVSSDSVSENRAAEVDWYDQPRFCDFGEVSTIHVLDLDSLAVTATGTHKGIELHRPTGSSDGRILVAASMRSGCAGESQLAVAEIKDDASLRILFIDEKSYRSRGTSIVAARHGRFFVVGQSERVFASRRYQNLKNLKDVPLLDVEQQLREREQTVVGDGLVIEFDLSGSIFDRVIVAGGASLYFASSIAVDERVMTVGSFGFEWVSMEFLTEPGS